MKNILIIRLVSLFVLVVLFPDCKKPTEFKEIEVNNLFTLQVPVYFHPTNELIPFDSPNIHQYEDSAGKICLMVFDSSRVEIGLSTLKTFYDSMVANPVMDSALITPPELVTVGNDSAYRSEITGIRNNIKVFSEIETIATKDRYYFILTWANLERRKELKPDMNKMFDSFREVKHLKI